MATDTKAAATLAALESMMTPIDEFTPNLLSIIYGSSGVGKTVLAMQMAQAITPPDKTIAYIDSAQGGAVLLNHPELRGRVNRWPWKSREAQNAILSAIEQGLGVFANVGCIIYDEFSNMADADLKVVSAERFKAKPDGSPDQAELQDYGKNQNRMADIVDRACTSGIHVIFVAHETQQQVPPIGAVRTVPNFRAKFGPIVKQRMHLIGYLIANDTEVNGETVYQRVLQIQPTKKVDAKSRVGTLTGIGVSTDEIPTGIAKWLKSGGTLTEDKVSIVPDASDTIDPDTTDYHEGIEAD